MRMSAYHLVRYGFCHIGEGEAAFFLGHAGVVDDLEQQIAKLIGQRRKIAFGDSVGDLVGFLDGVGCDGVESLKLVPRAAGVLVAQGGHDIDQAAEFGFGRGRGCGHVWRIGRAGAQRKIGVRLSNMYDAAVPGVHA